jgi:hypothetical protein
MVKSLVRIHEANNTTRKDMQRIKEKTVDHPTQTKPEP